jgi:hypothetical protein
VGEAVTEGGGSSPAFHFRVSNYFVVTRLNCMRDDAMRRDAIRLTMLMLVFQWRS